MQNLYNLYVKSNSFLYCQIEFPIIFEAFEMERD